VLSGVNSDVSIEIFDYNGVVVYAEFVPDAPLNYSTQVSTVQFPTGLYVIRVTGINEVQHVTLAKL
jgi:hypothetical protein